MDKKLLEGIKMDDTLTIIELSSDRVKYMFEILSVSDKYLEVTDEASLDKVSSANILLSNFFKIYCTHAIKSIVIFSVLL
jgi:hypothetical protein